MEEVIQLYRDLQNFEKQAQDDHSQVLWVAFAFRMRLELRHQVFQQQLQLL